MCGVAGIIDFRGSRVRKNEIDMLSNSLRHRGPDAEGSWIAQNGCVGLGHTRLSILDISQEASQPMLSHDERYVIVFNGEIYNFLELAELLRAKGYSFRTKSDTEVLIHAWDCWGREMFSRLNGMWAFAIYDTISGETLLCRDRFGVKPLYYFADSERLIFASEVQAIDKFLDYRLSPDTNYLKGLLQLDVGTSSHLAGINSVPAGFFMVIRQDGQIENRQWYSLSEADFPKKFSDQASKLKELIIDSCRLRLRSDVPVATCLSGGIDSGALVALLNKVPEDEQRFPGFNHRSFTAAFPGTPLDETSSAQLLAKTYDIDLDVEVIDRPSAAELESALHDCDGPMPTMAFYSIWKLYKYIKSQGITVTLDGLGPDEILGGYYLGFEVLSGAWDARNPLWFCDVYKTQKALNPSARNQIRMDLHQIVRQRLSKYKRPFKKRVSSPGMISESNQAPGKSYAETPVWVPKDHSMRSNTLAIALWRQFFEAPLPFFLHQYDRCSMASGVECRMPFMDYRLVEYLFSLPLRSRIGAGYTKRVLREAVRGILPDSIRLNRRKTGFNSPFNDWLSGDLREWVLDISGSNSFTQSAFFDGQSLSSEIHASSDRFGAVLNERSVWSALHLTWWNDHRKK